MSRFAFHRFWAIVLKEFIQMKRDRVTFAMMVGIPLMQLMLFGFAINSDPKHLSTAVLSADQGPFARTLVATLRNSGYFELTRECRTEAEAQAAKPFADLDAKWAPSELAGKNFVRVVWHSLADKPEKKPLLKRILRRN